MAKETRQTYVGRNDGNEQVIAEQVFINGKATTIKVDEEVKVAPYIKEILDETRKLERAANKPNEKMTDHRYI